MMKSAARSLTEPPGLRNSALPRIVQPVISEARRNLISGVLPTVPINPSRMSMPRLLEGAAPLYGFPQHYRALPSEGKPRLTMSAAFPDTLVGLEVPEIRKQRTLPEWPRRGRA